MIIQTVALINKRKQKSIIINKKEKIKFLILVKIRFLVKKIILRLPNHLVHATHKMRSLKMS